MSKIVAAILLCCSLAACSTIDLVAHGVKEYEATRQPQPAPAKDMPAAAPQAPAPAKTTISPTPSGPTVPPREDVRVEALN